MATKSCLALCACIAALSAAASARYIQAPPQSMNPAVRSNFNSKGFEEYFDEGKAGLLKNWWFSGVWANGQPFNVGWNPNSYNLNNYTVLELQVKKQAFTHSTGNHPYTAGELKSNDFYSAGCYSVCMKPSSESGTSSSFYAFNGFYDTKWPRHPQDPLLHFHNEIDIEFVGKDPWRVQTNYFSRNNWRVDPNMSGASGVEQWHDLGFNSQAQFHSYSIRWASWGIQWYVGPKLVRTVYRSNDPKIPDPKFGPLRIAANVWIVDQSAFGWAGRPSDSFTQGTSEYAWIKYQAGDKCEITPDCGF